ncbi:MAG: hypothetical protein M3Y49_06170 [Actinomycetota bacterium]|nr:hypothetical protein [Actinomycetota bacterium]
MAESGQRLLLPVKGPRRRWRVAVFVVLALYGTAALVSFVLDPMVSSSLQVLLAMIISVNPWLRWRRAAADQYGIRRQSAFRMTSWSDVQALIEPGRWDTSVHLRTTEGKDLTTGVPAAYLNSLVQLSGKPVERRPSASTKAPSKEMRDLSDRAARVRNSTEQLIGKPWTSDTTSDDDGS